MDISIINHADYERLVDIIAKQCPNDTGDWAVSVLSKALNDVTWDSDSNYGFY